MEQPERDTDLRDKVHLNRGELPAPRHDLGTPLVAGQDCARFRGARGGDFNAHGNYDVNGDGVFNVLDYACDSRLPQSSGAPGTRRKPAARRCPDTPPRSTTFSS
jgi:hypothetical protein